MKAYKFFQQYLFSPSKIGAIVPSSEYLANKMMENVQFKTAKYIVEYGAGTGVFTDKIVEYRNSTTIVMIFESNKVLFDLLLERYKSDDKLIFINDTVENIDYYTKKFDIPYVDYIISGLPFASLPKNVSDVILNKTKTLLRNKGKFITFQYTLFKKELFNQFFEQIDVTFEYRNLPPAFVLSCRNQTGRQ